MKALIASLFLIAATFFPASVKAAGEFAPSYNVIYDVDPSGVTSVSEVITLRNLTDRFYPSTYSLEIGSTKLTEIEAFDSQGDLPFEVQDQGTKTKITVQFINQQIAGKDKEYRWTLKFKSADFAQNMGKIWQVSIPKVVPVENMDQYNMTLSVPVSFGDPTSILPPPQSQTEAGGKLNLRYTKDQVIRSGILANFGLEQLYDFKLGYTLRNDSILPIVAQVALPANTSYQEIIINNITPHPENVVTDADGNYVAYFKVDRRQTLPVSVEGQARIRSSLERRENISDMEYKNLTQAKKYWEKDNPQIKTHLSEIFKDGEPEKNRQKANLINDYVVNFLQFNDSRIKNGDFQRLGGLTALTNSDKALGSEFTDLFITLARAANIPSRMLVGYAYTSNTEIRPFSFEGTSLHVWPEYYDPEIGWVMVDPTWENTSGGVDYFSDLGLNHLVFAKRGVDSEKPLTPSQAEVKFSESEFKISKKLSGYIEAPMTLYALFPTLVKVKVENTGNYAEDPTNIVFSTGELSFSGEKSFTTPSIPPFGFVSQEYTLKTNSLWDSYEDTLTLNYGNQSTDHKILIKPFFEYRFLSISVVALATLIIVAYLTVFGLHFKKTRKRH